MPLRLLKINLNNKNCKGIYLEDSNLSFQSNQIIDDGLKNNIKHPFKLVLKTSITINSKPIVRKKVFKFNSTTSFLKSVDIVSSQRDKFREDSALEILEPKISNQKRVEKNKLSNEKYYTLSQYWIEYCAYKQNTLRAKESWRPSTAKDMKSFYNVWIKTSKLSNMRLIDITTEDIEEVVSQIKRHRSLRTAKKTVEALSPLFKRFYQKHKIHEPNPANIDIGSLNNKRDVYINLGDVGKLYDCMFNYPIPKYRDVFIFLATGRRLNEVLSMKVQDIDLEKRQFYINEQNSKSGKKLTFILRDEMMQAIENKTDYIHASEKNTKMDGSTIRTHWNKVLKECGLKDIHIHDLRHIIGTVLRDSGVNEDIRALVLGHTKSSITARYATQNAELADEVYQFFLDKISGKINTNTKWTEV